MENNNTNRKILGLDLGTNSIGWALIEKNGENGNILGMGSRIISLGDDKTNYEQGKALTRNADKRTAKGTRKLNKRYKQRRNKLLYILYQLGLLPEQFKFELKDPKSVGEDGIFPKPEKIQQLSIKRIDPKVKQLTSLELYELRNNAINGNDAINDKDFGRLIYLFNQLRGYAGGGEDDEKDNCESKDLNEENKKETISKEIQSVTIKSITPKQRTHEIKQNKKTVEILIYKIEIEDSNTNKKYKGECYKEVIIGEEINIEIIKTSNIDDNPFFNIVGYEYTKPKPKKGGEVENIKAKVLTIEKPQDFYNKKWGFDIELSDGRIGILYVRNTEMAKEFTEGTEKELLIITNSEENEPTYTFEIPQKTNWRKKMEEFNKELANAEKIKGRRVFIGELFYEILQQNKWEKIRNRVILRKHYKAEFDAIWNRQLEKNEELRNKINDVTLLNKVLEYVFPGKSQEKYKETARQNGGFYHLIKDQIIYFQRPLKSQFGLIGICEFENTARGGKSNLKVIPQSHPLHQEIRIWQSINALSINTLTEENCDRFYCDKPLTSKQKVKIYNLLKDNKEVNFSKINSSLELRDKIDWLNGLNNKAKIKGSETYRTIQSTLGKELFETLDLENTESLIAFWRILYNWIKEEYDNKEINIDDYNHNPQKYHEYDFQSDDEYNIESERCKRIRSFIDSKGIKISEDQILEIAKLRFKRAYGSLSAYAINNILPLLKAGIYFDSNIIPEKISNNFKVIKDSAKDMITAIEEGRTDVKYDKAFLKKVLNGTFNTFFEDGGLMYSDAIAFLYGKHTAQEFTEENTIKNYHDIKTFFLRKKDNPDDPNSNLRNPVVEQITDEALLLVYSIWKQYGKPNEIHVELARELQNNAEQRSKIYKGIIDGEKTNTYVKYRLIELKKTYPNSTIEIIGTIPSQSNIEKYKIWRKQSVEKEPERKDIIKYRLWEEQGMISPYTLKTIPLSRLFSREYDIDHIIPKSRYFDDSIMNKIVCETQVNEEKGNRTPYEYLTAGSRIEFVKDWETFMLNANDTFFGQKRKYLLAKELPSDFIKRQLKETQYVTIKVKEELGKIVGTQNVKSTSGGITDYLRNQWHLNEKFKEVTKERFELMGKISGEDNWVTREKDNTGKERLKIKGWSKRYDHRHHAIDALVIACTEQTHVQRLNNLNKTMQSWFGEFEIFQKENKIKGLENFKGSNDELLTNFSKIEEKERINISKAIFISSEEKVKKNSKENGDGESLMYVYLGLDKDIQELIQKTIPGFRYFEKPWKDFHKDHNIEKWIESIIISHKPTNKLQIQKRKDAVGKEIDFLRIHGKLHEETLYGSVDGRPTYRVKLNSFFNRAKDTFKNVVSKTLSKQLEDHLNKEIYKGNIKKAFSPDGIEDFNRDRKTPVYSLKIFDMKEGQLADDKLEKLTRDINNQMLYVKTGSNYCCAICRSIETVQKKKKEEIKEVLKYGMITFFDATSLIKERMKFNEHNIEDIIKRYFEQDCEATKGGQLKFTLTPNDFVYLLKEGDLIPNKESNKEDIELFRKNIDKSNIYKVVKMDASYCFFVPHTLAKDIEYKPLKTEDTSIEDISKEENEKAKIYKEYDTYRDCSPFEWKKDYIENNLIGKKETKTLKQKVNELLNYLLEIKKNQTYSEIEQQVLNNLSDLIIANPESNLLKHIEKLDKPISLQLKDVVKINDKKKIAFKPIKIIENCVKIKLDRLGNIIEVNNQIL